MSLQVVAFAVLAALILYGSYKVVASPLITHSALFLALVLVSVAGVFLMLDAVFLAVVQVLVYAGAVMAVIIFAIMLSEQREIGGDPSAQRMGFGEELRRALRSRHWGLLPAAAAALLAVLAIAGIGRLAAPAAPGAASTSVADVGRALLTDYLVPFEIASAVLLAAVIGAIVLTTREGSDARDGGRS